MKQQYFDRNSWVCKKVLVTHVSGGHDDQMLNISRTKQAMCKNKNITHELILTNEYFKRLSLSKFKNFKYLNSKLNYFHGAWCESDFRTCQHLERNAKLLSANECHCCQPARWITKKLLYAYVIVSGIRMLQVKVKNFNFVYKNKNVMTDTLRKKVPTGDNKKSSQNG